MISALLLSSVLLKISRAGDYTTIDKGYIKICNCEFDVGQNNVTVNVIDDAYFARIKNNKEIESNIFSAISKNGVAITSPTSVQLRITSGCPSASSASAGKTVRVYDAFKYLVAFMTDDIMEFDSPVFGTGGDYENLCVNAGGELRDGVEKNKTTTSFSVLYQDMKKLLNLGFYIDNSGIKPKLMIDYDENIYTDSYSSIIHNVRNIKQSIYLDRLYSKVKFGGDSIANTGDVCGTAEKITINYSPTVSIPFDYKIDDETQELNIMEHGQEKVQVSIKTLLEEVEKYEEDVEHGYAEVSFRIDPNSLLVPSIEVQKNHHKRYSQL